MMMMMIFFLSAYAGFEVIAFSVEETRDPKKSLPIALGMGFIVTAVCNIAGVLAICSVANWMDIDPSSPFVSAFDAVSI